MGVRRQSQPGPAVSSGSTLGDAPAGCSVHEGLRSLVQLLPRVARGLRRSARSAEEPAGVPLGPRHRSALAAIRDGDTTVGALAAALDLNLATTSGLVADLERVGFVQRRADPADRRRTIVGVEESRRSGAEQWLDGSTAPIARVLEQLTAQERQVFVKAMGFLDAELNGGPGEHRTA